MPTLEERVEQLEGKKKKQTDNSGGIAVVVFIVGFCVLFIMYAALNIINLGTLFAHGPSFYIANIIHAHQNSYIVAQQNLNIYQKVLKLSELSNTNYIIAVAPQGQVLVADGYINKTASSWVAVSFIKEDSYKRGYLFIPKKIGTDIFKINSISKFFLGEAEHKEEVEKKLAALSSRYNQEFSKEIKNKKFEFLYITNDKKLQKFEESQDFKNYENISKFGQYPAPYAFIKKEQAGDLKNIYHKIVNKKRYITIP